MLYRSSVSLAVCLYVLFGGDEGAFKAPVIAICYLSELIDLDTKILKKYNRFQDNRWS